MSVLYKADSKVSGSALSVVVCIDYIYVYKL